jgi:hypothetical protein
MDDATIEKLLAAGVIERSGGGFIKTAKGAEMLRAGQHGHILGEKRLPIDSVRARSKPPVAKVKKRKR